MKELWDKAELKGLTHWQVYQILRKNGWQVYLHDYNPNAEWGNRERKRINKEAIEQTLIEIDYLV